MAFTIWDFKNEKVLSGILVAKLNKVPPYGKKVYGIQQKDGTLLHIWGYYQIVGHLAPLPFGTRVKIEYRGMGEVNEGKPPQHIFECTAKLEDGAKVFKFREKKKKAGQPPTRKTKTPPRAK